jgi:hypothetical protein
MSRFSFVLSSFSSSFSGHKVRPINDLLWHIDCNCLSLIVCNYCLGITVDCLISLMLCHLVDFEETSNFWRNLMHSRLHLFRATHITIQKTY